MARHSGASLILHPTNLTPPCSEPLAIRPCKPGDAETIFNWRNHPAIVAFSTLKITVSWEEHSNWLERQLRDSDHHRIFIAALEAKPVGMTRFDKADTGNAIVSAYLDPSLTGRGIGPQMIRNATENILECWLSIKGVDAEILEDNKTGQRGFAKAGYKKQETRPQEGHILYTFSRSDDESDA
jgi:UDP-2,4-diacetamido-2,4,6-trideoxy-beta-L-altropyranose hydrolase